MFCTPFRRVFTAISCAEQCCRHLVSRFADIPFPCGEDWMTAIGKFFPPHPDKQDSFFKENAEKFSRSLGGADQAWAAKRKTAMWRGSGTGGGATHEDNQRFKLHFLSDQWKTDDKYNENNPTGDEQIFLDAAVVQFSKRDKKVKGQQMGFDDVEKLPFKDKVLNHKEELYVPMFEQANHKYIIYVEGHCAANRYTFLMRQNPRLGIKIHPPAIPVVYA